MIDVRMELITAGTFMMGWNNNGVKLRYDTEQQHEVTLTKLFYIGKYTVTEEQWNAVMGVDRPRLTPSVLDFPATNVSWEDCQEFIKKLNAKTDGGYRLPTEAEWEYACRAGTTTAYSFGDEITPQDANYGYKDSHIMQVDSYKPNAFGLYCMHGNVWEWCEDFLGGYTDEAVTDPKGPKTGYYRMQRGGSWNSKIECTSSYCRESELPACKLNVDRYYASGFRLVRDIKGE